MFLLINNLSLGFVVVEVLIVVLKVVLGRILVGVLEVVLAV